jgi:hypothetical protein
VEKGWEGKDHNMKIEEMEERSCKDGYTVKKNRADKE